MDISIFRILMLLILCVSNSLCVLENLSCSENDKLIAQINRVFPTSDGSRIRSDNEQIFRSLLVHHMRSLDFIDKGENVSTIAQLRQAMTDDDIIRMVLLAIIGNFANGHHDQGGVIGRIVINPRTGELDRVSSHNRVQWAILEIMLVVSVLAICALWYKLALLGSS